MADPADRPLPPPPPPIDDTVVPEGADSEHQTGILGTNLEFLDDPAVNPEKMPFDDNDNPSDKTVLPAVSAVPGVNRNLGTQFERTVTRQRAKTHFDAKLDEVDPPETPELVQLEPTPTMDELTDQPDDTALPAAGECSASSSLVQSEGDVIVELTRADAQTMSPKDANHELKLRELLHLCPTAATLKANVDNSYAVAIRALDASNSSSSQIAVARVMLAHWAKTHAVRAQRASSTSTASTAECAGPPDAGCVWHVTSQRRRHAACKPPRPGRSGPWPGPEPPQAPAHQRAQPPGVFFAPHRGASGGERGGGPGRRWGPQAHAV